MPDQSIPFQTASYLGGYTIIGESLNIRWWRIGHTTEGPAGDMIFHGGMGNFRAGMQQNKSLPEEIRQVVVGMLYG